MTVDGRSLSKPAAGWLSSAPRLFRTRSIPSEERKELAGWVDGFARVVLPGFLLAGSSCLGVAACMVPRCCLAFLDGKFSGVAQVVLPEWCCLHHVGWLVLPRWCCAGCAAWVVLDGLCCLGNVWSCCRASPRWGYLVDVG